MKTAMSQIADDPPEPLHVAIIMDGNGRWAQRRGLPRTAGHKQGAEAVRRTVSACGDLGIGYLTLFGFSTENWKRPAAEVSTLMNLLSLFLNQEIGDLNAKGVQLRFLGDRTAFSHAIQDLMGRAETITRDNQNLILTVALNYGARTEILDAARAIAADVAAGRLTMEGISEIDFEQRLQTAGLPDPDLLLRTSGEKRISNFLLWQSAYTELVFDDTLWPDFNRAHLEKAIEEYQRRERRYGAVTG